MYIGFVYIHEDLSLHELGLFALVFFDFPWYKERDKEAAKEITLS